MTRYFPTSNTHNRSQCLRPAQATLACRADRTPAETVNRAVIHRSPRFVQAVAPETAFLQIVECAIDVRDTQPAVRLSLIGLRNYISQTGGRRSGMIPNPLASACAVRMMAPILCGFLHAS